MSDSLAYSVIVPAFNEEVELARNLPLLQRAMERSGRPGELIVVDNNSNDRTAEVARGLGARVVFEPVNQISRARNAGARAAAGRHLVFVDADTAVSPGLLAAALANLESGRCAGGGAVVELDAYPRRWVRSFVRLFNRLMVLRGLAAGAFVYCLREGFEAVGGFSQRLFAAEELAFSRSLRLWGRRHGLEFRVVTAHPVVTSSRKLRWHSTARVILSQGVLLLCPLALMSRRCCGFWYRRPADGQAPG